MDRQLIEHLSNVVGKNYVLHTPEDLAVYSYDGTFTEGQPDLVVLPATTEQVSQIVKLAAESRTNCPRLDLCLCKSDGSRISGLPDCR